MNAIRRLETFARAGYLARGVVYCLLGLFALTTAGAGSEGTDGVFAAVRDAPLGVPLLLLLAIGLAGYGVFRLYGAAVDLEPGDGAAHTARRIGHAASGLGHLFLAFTAAQLALGEPGGGEGATGAAGTVLDLPLGDWLLVLIGLGFLAAAVEQAAKAWTAKFMRQLAADAPDFAEWVGRAGFAARSVVFAIIGWSVLQAGLGGGADEVKKLGGALTELSDTGVLYTLVAVGLLLFGVFSLVMARYRTIRDEDVVARLKRRFAG